MIFLSNSKTTFVTVNPASSTMAVLADMHSKTTFVTVNQGRLAKL